MHVILPDGSQKELPDGATGADPAAAIGPGLARAALAVKLDGEVRDLARPLTTAASRRSSPSAAADALDLIRHDAAHVMAAAVMELYPGGEDLDRPPDRERLLLRLRVPGRRHGLRSRLPGDRGEDGRAHPAAASVREGGRPRRAALERFRAEGQDYKVELIEDLVSGDGVETVSLYTNGPFTDLCRGPHAPATERIGAAKLQSVAGAYWRGDAGQMLTRIYGTAFYKQASSTRSSSGSSRRVPRDHRKLGPELGLFPSPGRARDRPSGCRRGTTLFNQLISLRARWSRSAASSRSRRRCSTTVLWVTSGHWGKYRENMFIAEYEGRSSGSSR